MADLTVDLLLTAKEVSAMLKISVPTLYREMDRGHLPRPLKLGSCSRWPQSEILAALKAAAERRAA
ncbi:helix-turn-helix transcriptional regulator [Aquamicrobium soli]|uniref:Helix-turn-helix transcriptional regulator n=1 Tax=Aquamicrobium soli TaxID=1811518 RepID=A0ABV7KFQ6_9HYPH